jgi:hypothetical protein
MKFCPVCSDAIKKIADRLEDFGIKFEELK